MTKIIYIDNLEEYIRCIVRQELFGEYDNAINLANQAKATANNAVKLAKGPERPLTSPDIPLVTIAGIVIVIAGFVSLLIVLKIYKRKEYRLEI